MKHRQRAQSSSLFLMELILAILFFAITSAVCVQLFVKSHLLNQESHALTQAVNTCSSMAELTRSADSLSEAQRLIQEAYPQAICSTASDQASDSVSDQNMDISLFYDAQFVSCTEDAQVYRLAISLTQEDTLLLTDMNVIRASDSASIYQLQTKHHMARRTDDEG